MITRIDIGTKQKSILIDNMVGAPGKLKFSVDSEDYELWVAMPTLRDPTSDGLDSYSWVR